MLSENYAAYRGLRGYGGGLYLEESAGVQFNLAGFEGNTATNSAVVDDPQDYAVGNGGGIYAVNAPGLLITGPEQGGDRSLFVGNLGVLRGVGNGGALYIQILAGTADRTHRFSQ